jgi:hypothetical protein
VGSGLEHGSSGNHGAGIAIYLSHTDTNNFAPRWIRISNFLPESGLQNLRSCIKIDNTTSAYFSNGYAGSSMRGFEINGGQDIKLNSVLLLNNG